MKNNNTKILSSAKEIAILAMMTALLIGGQLMLSFVAGVEIVTVLLLCFAYSFGAKRGMVVATSFSLLRCFIFGFFVNYIILYLFYYNLFALCFGLLGKFLNKKGIDNSDKLQKSILKLTLIVVLAAFFTVFFTLLDDFITPVYYGYTEEAAKEYFISSLAVMLTQLLSTFFTVLPLFYPLVKVFKLIKE
jgi:thiamine transporter ThiT